MRAREKEKRGREGVKMTRTDLGIRLGIHTNKSIKEDAKFGVEQTPRQRNARRKPADRLASLHEDYSAVEQRRNGTDWPTDDAKYPCRKENGNARAAARDGRAPKETAK